MMETEMDDHLGYAKSQRFDNEDYRNGYKTKQVNSSYGSMEIEVSQDRKSTFEPQVVKRGRKKFPISTRRSFPWYAYYPLDSAKGITTRRISDTLEDIYGFEVSEGFISSM